MIKSCKSIRLVVSALILTACTEQEKDHVRAVSELTDSSKIELVDEFYTMLELDQMYRSYITNGTLSMQLVDSIKRLSVSEVIHFRQTHKSELSKDQVDSLWSLQNHADSSNTDRLYELTSEYGWREISSLDSLIDPMILLFHTPRARIESMSKLLLEEVRANRMKPLRYATYVDNMRVKAFGKRQLYGTAQEYDPNTSSIVPPYVENIDSTNMERLKIGLEELKEGDYRTGKVAVR